MADSSHSAESKVTHMDKEKNNTFSHKLRCAALFIVIASVAQLIFALLFTAQGLFAIYPTVLRMKSEKISQDNVFPEYFDVRSEFSHKGLYILGADTGVSASYDVIIDYLRFLKQSAEVSVLSLNISKYDAGKINDCLLAENPEEREKGIKFFRSSKNYSEEFCTFVRSLCQINDRLTPQRKISVASNKVPDLFSKTVSEIQNDIISALSTDPVLVGSYTCRTVDEFLAYVKANEVTFREFLGNEKFEELLVLDEHNKLGDYEEWAYSSIVSEYCADNTVLSVCEPNMIRDGSPLFAYISQSDIECTPVQIKYSKCQTLDKKKETVSLSDISVPFTSENDIFFVSAKKAESFISYYRKIANPSAIPSREKIANALSVFSTDSFFIVCNSDAVSYTKGEIVNG